MKIHARKIIRSKKGFEMNLVLTVLVSLVVLTVLLLLFLKLQDVMGQSAYNDKCKQSVLLYSFAAKNGINPLPDIKCPTQYKKFSGTDTDIKYKLAQEMYHCYDNFGSGDLEVFKRYRGPLGTDPTGDKSRNFCAICSVVDLQSSSGKVEGFGEYLQTQNVPGQKYTYAEYFTKQTKVGLADKIPKNSADVLDGNKKYAVLFMYAQDSYWNKINRAFYGAFAGAGATGVGVVAAASFVPGLNIGVWTGLGIVGIGSVVGTVVGAATGPTQGSDWAAAAVVWQYSLDDMKKLGCDEIPIKQH